MVSVADVVNYHSSAVHHDTVDVRGSVSVVMLSCADIWISSGYGRRRRVRVRVEGNLVQIGLLVDVGKSCSNRFVRIVVLDRDEHSAKFSERRY